MTAFLFSVKPLLINCLLRPRAVATAGLASPLVAITSFAWRLCPDATAVGSEGTCRESCCRRSRDWSGDLPLQSEAPARRQPCLGLCDRSPLHAYTSLTLKQVNVASFFLLSHARTAASEDHSIGVDFSIQWQQRTPGNVSSENNP